MKTWKIYDERYPVDFATVEEIVEHDFDLHAFRVSYLGKIIGTIYPDTIEDMDDIIAAFDLELSPIGSDDGMGGTISVGIWGTIEGIREEAWALASSGWTADDRDDLLIIYDLTEKQVDLLIECWEGKSEPETGLACLGLELCPDCQNYFDREADRTCPYC